MDYYRDVLLPRRLQLRDERQALSAGLQVIPFATTDPGSGRILLYTNTAPRFCMGGTYAWTATGEMEHPETGQPLPVFAPPEKVDVECLMPIEGDTEHAIILPSGVFSIVSKDTTGCWVVDESMTERNGSSIYEAGFGKTQAAKVQLIDIDEDGLLDLVVGENDWTEYWPLAEKDGKLLATHWGDQAYQPFDKQGAWRGGRLRGRVHVFHNAGEDPALDGGFRFDPAVTLDNVDQYGFCTPVFGDFTGDGRQDMICGDFLDNLTFFKRTGTTDVGIPAFAPGIPLLDASGCPRKLGGVINYLFGVHWSGPDLTDLLVGSENGYITFLACTGNISPDGSPVFAGDVRLEQYQPPVKADVLAMSAFSIETHGDDSTRTVELIAGGARGEFFHFPGIDLAAKLASFGRRLDEIPRVRPPDPIRGSVQGPSELEWGYVSPALFDWDGDGLADLVFSDINGEHHVCIRVPTTIGMNFSGPRPIMLEMGDGDDRPLVTTWRCRPALHVGFDGLIRYYTLDDHAQLHVYTKTGPFTVRSEGELCTPAGDPITFTDRHLGTQGRVKLQWVDWDDRGVPDLLAGLPSTHNFGQLSGNEGAKGNGRATIVIFHNRGTGDAPELDFPEYLRLKATGEALDLGRHECGVECLDCDGTLYLAGGAEDGHIYIFSRDEFD
jgi:hypothetical protein